MKDKKTIFIIGLFFAGIMLIGRCSSNDTNYTEPQRQTVSTEVYGTTTAEDLEMMGIYVNQRNEQGLNQMLRQGRIVKLPSNTKVYIKETTFSTRKIQLSTTNRTYWVTSESITKN